MSYLQGKNRYQTNFMVGCLDDFIDKNNSVRVIDEFVNMLDLKSLGFCVHDDNKRGQRPYDRKDLLKLHIYGYINGIRTSRKLEIETKRNLEVMWLINTITPDHGTISAFVKDNKNAFENIFRKISLLLKGWGLIDGKLIAIDGTKIKASNSKNKYLNLSTLDKKIEYIDSKINQYVSKSECSERIKTSEGVVAPINDTSTKEKPQEYKNRKKSF